MADDDGANPKSLDSHDGPPPDLEHLKAIERAERDERQADEELDAILGELRMTLSSGVRIGPTKIADLFGRADAVRARRQEARERRHRAVLASVLSKPTR